MDSNTFKYYGNTVIMGEDNVWLKNFSIRINDSGDLELIHNSRLCGEVAGALEVCQGGLGYLVGIARYHLAMVCGITND